MVRLVVTSFALLLACCLFSGCISIGGWNPFASPTPEPTPVPTATPEPTPESTPTPTPLACPESCDDGNPCTADECGTRTNFVCVHVPLSGPNLNCQGAAGDCMERACINSTCGLRPMVPCCGNGICEAGENCSCGDCGCTTGEICCNDSCRAPVCLSDRQCDDNNTCTGNTCENPGTCGAVCVNSQRTCNAFDYCCPAGCDFLVDNDCPAYSRTQWGTAASNLTIRVDNLFSRLCTRTASGAEERWLALRLTLQYNHEGTTPFNVSQVTLIDDFLSSNFSGTEPVNTDCYSRDADYLLRSGNIGETEVTGLIYFYYGDRPLVQQTKKIVIGSGAGQPRLVWLVSPTG